jgi:hypothetical protein
LSKRPDDLSPGDAIVTADKRRWRVSRIDRNRLPYSFLAIDADGKTVLAGGLEQLEWREEERTWVLR